MGDELELVTEFAAELAELIETSRDDVEEIALSETGEKFVVTLGTGEMLRVTVAYIGEDEADE